MNKKNKVKKELGDFQTPSYFTNIILEKLKNLGINASSIIEPTCGLGSFILSASKIYPNAKIYGYDINQLYISSLKKKLRDLNYKNIDISCSNFFDLNWDDIIKETSGKLLIIGNLPWVTNSTQGYLKTQNLPLKNNFLNYSGIDAITGKSNFDISEWMLIEILSWFKDKKGTIAMLVKESVARKVISYAKKQSNSLFQTSIYRINAKEIFNASVDACFMILQLDSKKTPCYDYSIYNNMETSNSITMGNRDGLNISNLDDYKKYKYLLKKGGSKWRSGIKHDSSLIMELTRKGKGYINGYNEYVEVESDLLYPLMKGSDIGSNKDWRGKFILVTQKFVGMDTAYIETAYPKIWNYLICHSDKLDFRASAIYKKNPRFSIFGVGDYSFKKWKIAICSLYKKLFFRLIGPIEGKCVQFDDTVYFISFDHKKDAIKALSYLESEDVQALLRSLIFWDDKRPIKTNILNLLNLKQ